MNAEAQALWNAAKFVSRDSVNWFKNNLNDGSQSQVFTALLVNIHFSSIFKINYFIDFNQNKIITFLDSYNMGA